MTETTTRPRATMLFSWLLGAWLMSSLAMTLVAIVNFTTLTPDDLREAKEIYRDLGDEETQTVKLRYAASELNRKLFDLYGRSQIVIGILALLAALAARAGRLILILTLVSLGAALAFQLWLVPEIVELGRTIDFMPRDPKPKEVLAFDDLHRYSVWIDGGKMIALTLASFLLFLRRPTR